MATKKDLADWVYEAIKANGGKATIVEVAKHIWDNHEAELRQTEELFYTWQYDLRWAANALRTNRIMRNANLSPKGIWELAK